ncbi:sugar phosphate isomerase/epimerase [Kiritimatiellota bacterium B12222]|nr:sugar phosphate isomerase/epimerase [Kiritimatiellota bacterium B12222]
MFKIGVMLESFRLSLEESIQAAAALNIDGIQLYATGGETHFSKLQGAKLEAFRHQLSDAGLEVAAVCGDFGGHGFALASENTPKIAKTQQVIDLAKKLNSSVVTTHIGVIPSDPSHPRYALMQAACKEIGRYAHDLGITLAIETGPEPAKVLRMFLDDLGPDSGVGVNFDPANLVMVCREDIPQAVETLAPYIVHTHAKDGCNLKELDPEILYGVFAGDPAPSGFSIEDVILETPLGEGEVPFQDYLHALRTHGYTDGYLTIEREVGEHPQQDIATAVNFLRKL